MRAYVARALIHCHTTAMSVRNQEELNGLGRYGADEQVIELLMEIGLTVRAA